MVKLTDEERFRVALDRIAKGDAIGDTCGDPVSAAEDHMRSFARAVLGGMSQPTWDYSKRAWVEASTPSVSAQPTPPGE